MTIPRKRYTPEEVSQHLRTVELDTGKGVAVVDACRKLGITEPTYYRWKKEHGGLRVDQAKRLKALEQENLRLKRTVTNQALDLSIRFGENVRQDIRQREPDGYGPRLN